MTKKFLDEVKLLDSNPDLILKNSKVDPHLYYLLLGKENSEGLSFLLKGKYWFLKSHGKFFLIIIFYS